MTPPKKKRSANWSPEEKKLLRRLTSNSRGILENKSNKTSINLMKIKEWKNITNILNEITGNNRSWPELKLAWKRMKMAAKANLSPHKNKMTWQNLVSKSPDQVHEPSSEFENIFIKDISVRQIEDIKPHINNLSNGEDTRNEGNSSDIWNEDMHQKIYQSNIDIKTRQLEILEIEHGLNKKIAALKIKKLELEIAILLKKKHNSTTEEES